MGHRQDFIINKHFDDDVGVGEGKVEDTNTNMMTERGMKCPKAMKDALWQLFKKVSFQRSVIKELSVEGITTFGKSLISLTIL